MMTYVEVATQVLQRAGGELTNPEIYERAVAAGLIVATTTPASFCGALDQVCRDPRPPRAEHAPIYRNIESRPNTFGLKEWGRNKGRAAVGRIMPLDVDPELQEQLALLVRAGRAQSQQEAIILAVRWGLAAKQDELEGLKEAEDLFREAASF